MKALKITAILLLFLLITGVSYVAVQPGSYDIHRTRTVSAPVSLIYKTVNDYKKWVDWSPWKAKDPSLEFDFSDQTIGVGSHYIWTGKDGKGKMTTLATAVNDSILQELKFEQFPPSLVYWNFNYKSPQSTEVTWGMRSDDVPFLLKFFALISGGMDRMIGPDYDQGLENLDYYLQKQMAVYSVEDNGITDYGEGFYLYLTSSVTPENIDTVMRKNYTSIYNYMAANSIRASGKPMSIYQYRNAENGNMIFSCAVSVNQNYNIKDASGILCGYIPRTKALKTTLLGNYENLSDAWTQGYQMMNKLNLSPSSIKPFEIYITDPDETPNPADWITELYIPLK